MEISLSAKGLTNLSHQTDFLNFSFIINDFQYRCNSLLADFISPIISHIHKSDPLSDHFNINNVVHPEYFELFLKLMKGEKIQIEENQAPTIEDIAYQLGNVEIIDKLKVFHSQETTVSNVISKLSYKNVEIDPELIDFCAEHLVELNNDEIKELAPSIFQQILISPSLKIRSEDWLYKTITQNWKDSLFLLDYVRFENLSSDIICEFLDSHEPCEISGSVWSSLSRRILLSSRNNENGKNSSRFNSNENCSENNSYDLNNDRYIPNNLILLPYKESEEFKGIFNYLSEINGGNPIMTKSIEVTSSIPYQSDHSISNIFEYSPERLDDRINLNGFMCKGAKNQNEMFIKFDFKSMAVSLSNYVLRTGNCNFPKTWEILGSNDDSNWETLSSINDDEKLTKSYSSSMYSCTGSKSKLYRFIKYVQYANKEINSFTQKSLSFSAIEFFGSLHLETPNCI